MNEETQKIRTCSQSGCDFPNSCLEGLEEERCPYLSWKETQRSPSTILERPEKQGSQSRPEREDKEDDILLPTGESIPFKDANQITYAHKTKLIVLMGARDSGKTTLLAELHQKFLEGPFADYMFAGSRTLIGLEKRIFLARTRSQRPSAGTKRTPTPEGFQLLHLCVRPRDISLPFTNLLITDISGEYFTNACSNREDAKRLHHVLQNADQVVLLLDGEKLSNKRLRQIVRSQTNRLLQMLIETECLNSSSYVDIVFSKWDCIANSDETRLIVDIIKSTIEEKQKQHLGSLTFREIAARPSIPETVEEGYGMKELFISWVQEGSKRKYLPHRAPTKLPPPKRAIASYRFPHNSLK